MEKTIEYSLELLNKNFVNVLTKEFIVINGVKTQVGLTDSLSYSNNAKSRELLSTILPTEYYNAVLAVWGV